MSTEKELPGLALDPGKPHQKPSSPFKCLIWSGIICVGLFSLICVTLVLFIIYTAAKNFIQPHLSPQSWVYHNMTLGVSNHSEVVIPLIDQEQRFDIVASVWIRNGTFTKPNEPIPEALLFSGVVFRGVSLKDSSVVSSVNFQVPTSIFKQSRIITNFDLRGSFALIPSSPLLDHIVNVTSWIPGSIAVPPVRPSSSDINRALRDYAIDSFGISVPLIEFHPINSRCSDGVNATELVTDGQTVDWDVQLESADTTEINVIKYLENPYNRTKPPPPAKSTFFTSNMNLSDTEGHPHIATRTHLRAADFTKILNYTKFNNILNVFRNGSCGQETIVYQTHNISLKLTDGGASVPCWQLCHQTASATTATGGFGTLPSTFDLRKTSLLQFDIPEESGLNRTEWAYAPYLSTVKFANRPNDFIPVPVMREHCDTTDSARPLIPDEDLVNVTWSITYSGRTPMKILVGDTLGTISWPPNTNSSETERLKGQLNAELIHGLYGHRHHENAHPRRYFAISSASELLDELTRMSIILYWYTRVSTTGISTGGTAFVIVSDLISIIFSVVLRVVRSPDYTSQWTSWISMLFIDVGVLNIILILLMLKQILRLKLQWRYRVLPFLKAVRPTHSERDSIRVDAKLWRLRILILVVTMLGNWAMKNELLPRYEHLILTQTSNGVWRTLQAHLLYSTGTSLYLAAFVSQLVFNYQRQTFASMYRITAIFIMTSNVMGYLIAHPSLFVGEMTRSPASKILFRDYIWTILYAVNLYQAFRYRSTKDKDDEE